LLILATIPAVIVALVFRDTIEHVFESGRFLGFSFLITTALLVTAELLSRRARTDQDLRKAEDMNWLDALVTGLLQAVAIAPGISRSGATVSGALSRRLARDFAARFSFLLSIPAILGALVLQTKDLIKGAPAAEVEAAAEAVTSAGGIGIAAVIAGTLVAAVVGFFAVRFMLKIIKEKSLFGFAIYTAVLGILIIIDLFGTHLVF
jgi:undecaprenyl-diphosphatase